MQKSDVLLHYLLFWSIYFDFDHFCACFYFVFNKNYFIYFPEILMCSFCWAAQQSTSRFDKYFFPYQRSNNFCQRRITCTYMDITRQIFKDEFEHTQEYWLYWIIKIRRRRLEFFHPNVMKLAHIQKINDWMSYIEIALKWTLASHEEFLISKLLSIFI